MATITKLTATSQFNPAVGKTYIMELSNGERFEVTDDELMERFSPDEVLDWKIIIGESWQS